MVLWCRPWAVRKVEEKMETNRLENFKPGVGYSTTIVKQGKKGSNTSGWLGRGELKALRGKTGKCTYERKHFVRGIRPL